MKKKNKKAVVIKITTNKNIDLKSYIKENDSYYKIIYTRNVNDVIDELKKLKEKLKFNKIDNMIFCLGTLRKVNYIYLIESEKDLKLEVNTTKILGE